MKFDFFCVENLNFGEKIEIIIFSSDPDPYGECLDPYKIIQTDLYITDEVVIKNLKSLSHLRRRQWGRGRGCQRSGWWRWPQRWRRSGSWSPPSRSWPRFEASNKWGPGFKTRTVPVWVTRLSSYFTPGSIKQGCGGSGSILIGSRFQRRKIRPGYCQYTKEKRQNNDLETNQIDKFIKFKKALCTVLGTSYIIQ